ncbi:MAG: hypothetical protein ABI647_15110 [Gemmatimonadota bacterium]
MKARAVAQRDSLETALAKVGYWIAAGLILDQLVQVWSSVDGFDLAVPAWRFQVALLFSGKALVLLLGAVVAVATARLYRPSRQTPILRGVLVLALVGCLVMAGVLAADGAAVAYTIPGAQFRGFTASRLRGIGLLIGAAATFWGLVRVVRPLPEDSRGMEEALNRSTSTPPKTTQPQP